MSGPAAGGSNDRSSGFSLDNNGEARLALREILRDYGPAGIDDDALITRHVPDLLPDAPREAGLLRAAASAQVGHLLTDRFAAHMPTEAAVRDVAAILAERTALDLNACLWIVTEYSAALGRPVEMAPMPVRPAPPEPTRVDMQLGPVSGPVPAAPPPIPAGGQPFQPGRANPVFVPAGLDNSGAIQMPRPRSKAPLIVGIVILVVVIAAAIGITLALHSPSTCTTATCTASTHTSHPPTHKPTPTPTAPKTPSASPSPTLTTPSTALPLDQLLPKDVKPDSDACDQDSDNNQLDGTSAFYHCREGNNFAVPGLEVWAYQFPSKTALTNGLTSLNHEVNFRVVGTGACPPSNDTDSASHGWQRGTNGPVLGTLECFTGTKSGSDVPYANYIWTDPADLTLIDASSPGSFTDLGTWWSTNNNNSVDG